LKKFVFIFFCFSSAVLFSQSNPANFITGTWHGVLLQPDSTRAPFTNYAFWLDLRQSGDSVFGVSRIEVNNTLLFGVMNLRGTFVNNTFHFEETGILNQSVDNRFYWCIKKGDLVYDAKLGVLKGPWSAISPSTCAPGEITVYKSEKIQDNSVAPCREYVKFEEFAKMLSTQSSLLCKMVIIESLQFDKSKSTLLPSSTPALNKVVELLKQYPTVQILILGHTDDEGDDSQNLLLSFQRSKTVSDYLAQAGINKTRLKCEGFGESRPIADNDTEEGKTKNRRVELEVIY